MYAFRRMVDTVGTTRRYTMTAREFAIDVVRKLQGAGGCVRDELLRIPNLTDR